MKYPKKFDLHLHSTVSDGTDTPEELLSLVREAGLELFALTDHDAILGCKRILTQRRANDPAFLTGVEFSCQDEIGKYHVLGYGYDPEDPIMQALVEKTHQLRMDKAQARLDFLQTRFGFSFPPEELAALLALDNPGKPHIGNLMVKYGYAASKDEAIRRYLDQFHSPDAHVRPEEAITAILRGGGIPVQAHPCFGGGDDLIVGAELERRTSRLIEYGLRGLEAFYSGYSRELRQEVIGLAERQGLYITAGSDYHGKNKLVTLSDTGLDQTETRPDGLLRFLDDISGLVKA